MTPRTQHLERGRRWTAALVLAALVVCPTGCEQAANTPPVTQPAATASRSPRATLQEIRRLHAGRRYDEMRQWLTPTRASATIELLLAVDRFLGANDRLCEWIGAEVGTGLAQSVDQSYLADELGTILGNNLNVLAHDVELLDETEAGDTARVVYVVAGRVPAQVAILQRGDGHWQFDPGPVGAPSFAAGFIDMATALDTLRRELADGRVPKEELRTDMDRLMDLVEARLKRGVRMLSQGRAQMAERQQ